jgi:hypothetical protein
MRGAPKRPKRKKFLSAHEPKLFASELRVSAVIRCDLHKYNWIRIVITRLIWTDGRLEQMRP